MRKSRYAAQLGLDVAAFDRDRASAAVLEQIQSDIDSGLASGQVIVSTPAQTVLRHHGRPVVGA